MACLKNTSKPLRLIVLDYQTGKVGTAYCHEALGTWIIDSTVFRAVDIRYDSKIP